MNFLKIFKPTKKKLVILLIAIAVFAAVVFIRSRNNPVVESTTIKRGTVQEELILTGSIRAEKHSILSFPTSGKISWIGATEGQLVKKGSGLISLDKTILNTIYQQALNSYKDKQAAAEKAEDDVKDHSGDETFAQKSSRTTAQVARDNAYDSVLAAAYNLKNATLVAPFEGFVTALYHANPGVNITASEPVIEVLDPSTIYFETEADQSEVTKIKLGQEVVIILDSFEDKKLNGKVQFIGLTPKSTESGAVYKVKVNFEDTSDIMDLLKVGMTGDARFILSQSENVLFAPPKFVNSDKKGRFVNLGKIGNRVEVEVGIEGEDQVEIKSGVNEGDVIYD